ncbi:HAD family phosphatase [Candidatus Woesearchaeota archaeon]|nr:HAD family phosphatase [Candidatus Woesearchaeota archaeon]
MKKAVIFDMDGVLVDTENFHCDAWIKTFADHGILLTEEQYHQTFTGTSSPIIVKEIMQKHDKSMPDIEGVVYKKTEYASSLMQGKLVPLPGVRELIMNLYKKKYKLGLASSSGMQVVSTVLSSLDLEGKFMVVHSGEAVKQGKPNPDIYLQTAALLEVLPEYCVVIEDSKAGIIAARSAGMKCIGIMNGKNKREDLQHANIIAEHFDQITEELINEL